MELQITGTNLEITPKSQRYIEGKFNKLIKHLPDIIDIKVEITEEGTKSPQQRYLVRAAVNSGVGRTVFHAEERAEDLQQAADKAADVLKS
jgi:ribosomal subunit interface protein